MKGYKLIQALRDDANDCANDNRRDLIMLAAQEIEALIKENRALMERLEKQPGK